MTWAGGQVRGPRVLADELPTGALRTKTFAVEQITGIVGKTLASLAIQVAGDVDTCLFEFPDVVGSEAMAAIRVFGR